MNKQELVDAVASEVGISKSAAEEAIGAVLETISKKVAAGGAVQLVGFGTFGLESAPHERVVIRQQAKR
ncbi:hypothetical protein CBA19CS11_31960 [Caballeronia novacaledonica]|nr:hypothetical protein CBA19CS11_31960 [Caballeronia novacaledonica]